MYRFLKKLTMRVSKKRNHHKTDIHPAISSKDETQEEEEQRFNAEFRQTLVSLEKKLHSAEDQAAIIMEGIKTVCKFHDADWAGILILDKTSELWEPAMWYEPGIGEMGPTLFHEVEYFEHFPRWVQALKTGTPIVIPDIRAEHIPPKEAAQYERLATNSVIGAPFGDRPTGFLVVRNPKRYPHIPDLVQMLAFVTLSSYYLQEFQDGMQMMRETSAGPSTKAASVTIRLFGVPEIVTATGQVNEEVYHSENGWKLLTFLALRKSPVPSRSIAAELWPNDDRELKTDNIRHIIYRFKSRLAFLQPNELIVNTPSGYALNSTLDIFCDVHEFCRLCRLSEQATVTERKIELLRKAVNLYRGDIYAKFSHEHWLMADAAHYQMKYLDVSAQLMSMLAAANDFPAVQEVALQAIRVIPGNVNACYWMTISLHQLGGKNAAEKMISSMRPKLTEEEFEELRKRLKNKIW